MHISEFIAQSSEGMTLAIPWTDPNAGTPYQLLNPSIGACVAYWGEVVSVAALEAVPEYPIPAAASGVPDADGINAAALLRSSLPIYTAAPGFVPTWAAGVPAVIRVKSSDLARQIGQPPLSDRARHLLWLNGLEPRRLDQIVVVVEAGQSLAQAASAAGVAVADCVGIPAAALD